MKSYWIKADHGKTALELREVPIPQPKKGEILVRMRAASLNRGELLASIGLHSAAEARPAGGDGAGEVQALGESVAGFKPGDRVMVRARGSFSEYVVTRAEQVFPAPQRLSWEQAGAIPTAFVTAYEMLVPYGGLKSGEWLLVAGASSGVGVACVQIGKMLGDVGPTIKAITHHFSHFNFIFSGSDYVVCEGTSHGEHRDGPWRAGVPSWGAGHWCDVFEIRDWKIQRCYIYLDPDYAGKDTERYPWLAGKK